MAISAVLGDEHVEASVAVFWAEEPDRPGGVAGAVLEADLAEVLDDGVGAGGDDAQAVAPGGQEQVAGGLAQLEVADDPVPAAGQLDLDVDGRGVGAGVGDPQAGQVARDGVAVAQDLELEGAAVAGQGPDGGDGGRPGPEAHVGLEGGRVIGRGGATLTRTL